MSTTYKDKITQVPVFTTFAMPLRDHIAEILVNISKPRVLKKGERLYAEGAIDDNTGAILVDGGLLVSYGREHETTVLLQAPEMVGEMQQFNKYGTRTATVSAGMTATVLEFAWHDLVSRIQDRPDINHADHTLIRDAFKKFAGDRFKRREE